MLNHEVSTAKSWLTSLRLDAGGADHLGPFPGFLRDQLAELGGRARQRLAADGGQPCLHSGISDGRIDFPVELVDDFSRRVGGRADAIPLAGFVSRHEIPRPSAAPAAVPRARRMSPRVRAASR